MTEPKNEYKSASTPFDNDKISFKGIFRQRDPESSFVLFIVPVLLIIWVYYGRQGDFEALFKGFQEKWNLDFFATIYEYLTAFLLMFWIPYFFVRMVFRGNPRDFGLCMGDWKFGSRFVLKMIPLAIWIIYAASSNTAIQAEYPLAKSTVGHLHLFIIIEIVYLFYYFSWEFFFRGFMLFSMEKQFGALPAILIQTMPSVIVHIGKPAMETFGAVLAGLVFGYLALRTRSIIYPLILHAIIGIGINLMVVWRVY